MSRHENQNKKRKKWRYVYRKFGITQRFNIEDTEGRSQITERFNIEDTKERSQIRLMEVKKVTYGETL